MELMDKLAEYAKRFGEGFPMYQLGRGGRTDKEVIEIIDMCLNANKDAYELGLCSNDSDVLY